MHLDRLALNNQSDTSENQQKQQTKPSNQSDVLFQNQITSLSSSSLSSLDVRQDLSIASVDIATKMKKKRNKKTNKTDIAEAESSTLEAEVSSKTIYPSESCQASTSSSEFSLKCLKLLH